MSAAQTPGSRRHNVHSSPFPGSSPRSQTLLRTYRLHAQDFVLYSRCSPEAEEVGSFAPETPIAGHLGGVSPRVGRAVLASQATELEVLQTEGLGNQDDRIGLISLRPPLVHTLPRWTVFQAAAAVAPLWFLAQLCFNLALSMTSVTSNTILSSPSSLFTFFLSVLFLGERFTIAKLVAVALTVVGPSPCTRIMPGAAHERNE
jgi:multidrug transporter EmrE-like cation transporter